jgi:predicted nuclease with RNAse H fold
MGKKSKQVILRIDLAGSPKRPTGVCILRGVSAETVTVLSDEEMLEIAQDVSPVLCPIDAPLSLPPGRKSLEDRNGEHLRPCDRELQKMGVRFFRSRSVLCGCLPNEVLSSWRDSPSWV